MNRKKWIILASAVATCLTVAGTVLSQESRPALRGPEHRAVEDRHEQGLRERLGVSEEQWKTLGPQVEKVQHLLRDSGMAMAPGMWRQPPASQNLTNSQQKSLALHKVLEDPNATPDQIKAGVKDLREAREQAHKDLKPARADLKKMVADNPKLEARLVLMGILE